MVSAALLLSLVSYGQPEEAKLSASHKEANPVYRLLIDQGIFEGKPPGQLPLPTMADGLNAAAQLKILNEIGKPRHDFKSLTRKTTVAPHLADIHTVKSGDSKRPLQCLLRL